MDKRTVWVRLSRSLRAATIAGMVAFFLYNVEASRPMGAVSGTLFYRSGGRGIPAALVSIEKTNYVTRTDPDGRFAFPHVPAGEHRLRVEMAGRPQPFLTTCTVMPAQETSFKLPVLPDGTIDPSMTFSDLPLGSLSGRVFSATSGKPLAGARIIVSGTDHTTETDSTGVYNLPNLGVGSYTVSAIVEGCPITIVNDVMITTGSTRMLDIAQQQPSQSQRLRGRDRPPEHTGTIVGTIVDGFEGSPLPGVTVEIEGLGITTLSDRQGFFRLRDVPSLCRDMHLTVTGYPRMTLQGVTAIPLQVTSLNIRTYSTGKLEYDLSFTPWEPGAIEVALLNASTETPLDEVSVCLDSLPCLSTGIDGKVIFGDVDPGMRRITVQTSGFMSDTLVVPVYEGRASMLTVQLRPQISATRVAVNGRPYSAVVVKAISGDPLPGVTVQLASTGETVATNATGTFSLSSLPPGAQTLIARHESHRTTLFRIPETDSVSIDTINMTPGVPAQISIAGQGSSGTITGRVVDAGDATPLPGATITPGGFPGQALALDSGRFVIGPVPEGIYTLQVAKEGFGSAAQTIVVSSQSNLGELLIKLRKETVTDLLRMAVTTSAAKNTESGLLKERQRAISVTDGISGAEISKAGAGNVADAMKQITGVTVLDGKYIVIRGLSERYVSTTLNGMVLPSPDPDKRAVPLDMFPTALLDNLVVSKTFSAEKPAEFAGGNINIQTNAIPDKMTLGLSVRGTADGTTFGPASYLTYEGGRLDWLGIDDGTRGLPQIVRETKEIPNNIAARTNRDQAYLLDTLTKAFTGDFIPDQRTKRPDLSMSAMGANRFTIGHMPLGVIISGSYSNSSALYDEGINSRFHYQQQIGLGDYSELGVNRAYLEDRSTKDILWGGLAALTFEPLRGHQLNFNYLYVHNAEDDIRHSRGRIANLEAGRIAEYYSILYSERNLSTFQFTGTHRFPAALQFDWKFSQARTRQNQPDQRTMMLHRYTTPDTTDGYDYRSHENILPVKDPERYFRVLNEENQQLWVDLTYYPLDQETESFFVRTGGKYLSRKRDYRIRRFSYAAVPRSGVDLNSSGGPEHYFDHENLGIVSTRMRGADTNWIFGLYVSELNVESVNYDAQRTVPAWYIMSSLQPLDWLTLVGGARYETADIFLENFVGDKANKTYRNLLPAISSIVDLPGNMKLRAGYGRTLARPTERELAPYSNFDPAENVSFSGNPNLVQTTIDNLDLRWESFQHHSDLVSASAFYKDLDKPIEKVVIDNNGGISYRNVERASIMGLELEARLSLERFTSALSGVVAGGNCSFIKSALTIDQGEYHERRLFDRDAKPMRQLQGQSPWVVNTYLTHTHEALGVSTSVFFHMVGPTITAVSQGDAPDVYSVPYPVINLTSVKKLGKGMSVELGVRNLFGDRRKSVSTFADQEFVNIEQFRERSFNIKLSYKFQ